ncbi:Uncharacterised protein [Halioglobus japonicus]|nr:Uncharacterised protein [Halioglobus japonicus]
MRSTRLQIIVLAACLFLLQACATAPDTNAPSDDASAKVQRDPVELTLNLPENTSKAYECTPQPAVDRTFLDKGISNLAAGDYREAVNYFRRYQRLESSPGVDWEAGIAVAYVKMIPTSPYYNWRAAHESYLRLMRKPPKDVQLNEQIILMRDMLAILVNLHLQVDGLQSEKAAVTEDLEKREEALRRLRELMLGQKEAIQ